MVLALLAGCGSSGPTDNLTKPTPVATSISISPATAASVTSGASLQLTAIVLDQNGAPIPGATVTWSTSDAARASVSSSGLVTGALRGTATITASSGSLTSAGVVITVVTGPVARIDRARDMATGLVIGAGDTIAAVVRDAGGNPVVGVTVNFAVTSGGGTLSQASAVTDIIGIAAVRWTTGTVAGTQTATATVAGSPLSTTFSVNVLPGPTALLSPVGTVPATAGVGSIIDSIVVVVTDAQNNPRVGETVTFTVTGGGGLVSPTTVVTGSNGRAAARWIIGTTVGALNTVTARVAALPSAVVTFSVTATAPAVTSLSFAARTVPVDSAGTVTLAAVSRDGAGNPVAGATATYVSRGSAVAVTPSGVVTGVRTGQAFVVATSSLTPTVVDSVLVVVGVPGAPVVITTMPRFDLKTDTTFTIGIVVDMRNSGEKLGATTIQVNWDTRILSYVSDAEGAANAGATVNTSFTSGGTLTLAVASSAGFSGAVEVRKITFRAASAAGRGNLTMFIGDMVGAATFTNFLARTVAASYPLVIR